jgi:rare lipoprotein A
MTLHPAGEAGRRSASYFRDSLGRQLDQVAALASSVAEDWGSDGEGGGHGGLGNGMGIRPGFSPAYRRASANYMHGPLPGAQDLTWVQTPGGKRVRVNKESAEAFHGFLGELEAGGAPIHSLGGHNQRRIAGSGHWSQHAYGNAIDINQQSRDVVDRDFAQWARAHPNELRGAINRWGIISGGDWRNPDFGHFEWGGTRPWAAARSPASPPAPAAAAAPAGFAPAAPGTPLTGAASTYNPYKPGWRSGGGRTASGEPYDPQAWTAAIQTGQRHKFGGVGYGKDYQPSYALVEHDGKQAIVRINDVGPLTRGRVIDLNERSMRYFDPTAQKGVLPGVKVTPLAGANWTPGPVTPRAPVTASEQEPNP